jgi:hypothetical protein
LIALLAERVDAVFPSKRLDPLDQRLSEFKYAREIGIEVWRLIDVVENGAKEIAEKDGGHGPHNGNLSHVAV